MGTLEEAERTRAGSRSWLTRAVKEVERLCMMEKKDLDREEMMDALQDLEDRIKALDEAQNEVELFLEVDTEGHVTVQWETDIERANKLRKDAKAVYRKGRKLLPEKHPSDDDMSTTSSNPGLNIRLPKIELPKFTGKQKCTWTAFWEAFDAGVDSLNIPKVQKFTYLKGQLRDKALKAIGGIKLEASLYDHAVSVLMKRFGRKELLRFEHIQCLLELQTATNDTLQTLVDEVQMHVRSLEKLEIPGEMYGVFLTPLILSKLPENVCLEWARNDQKEGDLEFLMEFLQAEIERLDRCKMVQNQDRDKVKDKKATDPEARPIRETTSALAQGSESRASVCDYCGKSGHGTPQCYAFLKLSVTERREVVRDKYFCYRCLSAEHRAYQCDRKCADCQGRHHVACCPASGKGSGSWKDKEKPGSKKDVKKQKDKEKASTSKDQDEESTDAQAVAASSSENTTKNLTTVLPLANVEVREKEKSLKCTLLFDGGSDKTYVSTNVVKQLRPRKLSSETVSYAAFGGGKATGIRDVYAILLVTKEGLKSIKAVEIEKICQPLKRRPVIAEIPVEIQQELADLPSSGICQIEILIGQDNFWNLMKTEAIPISKKPALVVQKSVFGLILSGSSFTESNLDQSFQLCNISDLPQSIVQTFWNLDTIGIKESENEEESLAADPVVKEFEEKIRFNEEEKRYEVSLPWKGDLKKNLRTNYGQARAHLAKRKMNAEIQQGYDAYFVDLESQGIIVECDKDFENSPTIYLTHRPVVRESSTSTRIRPVFNASLPGPTGVSLNDCLNTGPNLLPDLTKILLRFRRWPVALSADITKAFLQIQVKDEDTDVLRFLLKHNDVIRKMKFKRVTFGLSCSPFLLNATLQHHLRLLPSTKTVQELIDNLYVDDWLSGANEVQSATKMYQEAQEALQQAGMTLAKWTSNKDIFAKENTETNFRKILGIQWLSDEDAFCFVGFKMTTDILPTKRIVLSFIARIFDPLGLIVAFVMTLKILLQDIWKLGLEWDEVLPEEYGARFMQSVRGSGILAEELRIPRCYQFQEPWNERDVTLTVYCDASQRGFGCCVYIQTGEVSTLAFAKARVAPMKPVTLARLELLAALLGARSVCFVRNALNLSNDVKMSCYSDSMIVIHWIKGDATRWKQYVRNRVEEIQSLTDPASWRHVKGTLNPADLLTRGIAAKDLIEDSSTRAKLWFHGPNDDAEVEEVEEVEVEGSDSGQTSPKSMSDGGEEEYAVPEILAVALATLSENDHEDQVQEKKIRIVPIERYSSLSKALRVTGLCLRFMRNARLKKDERNFNPPSAKELHESHMFLIKQEQRCAFSEDIERLNSDKEISRKSKLASLNPFIDTKGLLRKGSRVDKSTLSYSSVHPMILPSGYLAKLILRFMHKQFCHPGVDTMINLVRKSYWIIGLRNIAKKIKSSCIPCQRQDARRFNEAAASLPADRVTKAAAFTVTGVDYAGPLFCNDSDENLYVLLATCAVTRAVHFELVNDQSLPNFLLALRRLAGRRGLPKIIYSDNAKTFKAAETALNDYFGPRAPIWKYIPPLSPWWGGWWERLVGCMKSGLKKTIGKRSLSRVELETTLVEVESTVNNRPLTFVGDDPDYDEPLTPSDFLIGCKVGFDVPLEDGPVTPEKLSARETVRLDKLNKCWRDWSEKYLKSLPSCVSKFKSSGKSLKVGSLVLIREDAPTPRMKWPIGVIEKLYFGGDGKCRVVDVRTNKGTRTRDVRRLHVLEMNEDIEVERGPLNDNDDSVNNENVEPVNQFEDTQGNIDDSLVEDSVEDGNSGESAVPAGPTDSVTAQGGVTIRSRRDRRVRPRLILDI